MLRYIPLVAAVASALVVVNTEQSQPLREHVSKLRSTTGVELTLTATEIGGAAAQHSLIATPQGQMRWETPAALIIVNGQTKWTLDKSSNTYTEESADAAAAKAAISLDPVWLYAAILDQDWEKSIIDMKAGRERKLSGIPVQEFQTIVKTAIGQRSMTLMLSTEDKTIRGAILPSAQPGGPDTIVIINEVSWNKALKADQFTFSPPEGSKKIEPGQVKAVPAAEALSVLRRECSNCHGANAQQAGVRLDSYEAVMGSSVVVPGNAEASRVIRALKGTGAKPMPPGRKIVQTDIDKVAGWIQAGAKNE
ncbi:c-type cytochrome domain-containing protein [Kamptonema cortianum]|nr:hypothetical protein [Geitlerinema splendidum]MDK3156284.1 c-type cytochrome domain-containing protein [Kamptonema cortianum]